MANDAKITVDGDIGPLKAKLAEMQGAMKSAGEKGGEHLQKMGGAGEDIGKLMTAATGGIVAFGTALAGVALAKFIEGTVEARAALMDLSETTGASVENISALSRVAMASGESMDSIAGALQVMSRNMVSADEEGTKFAGALRAIGLDASRLKNMDPAAVMLEVAKALDQYQDGMGKTAAAQAIFGKSGAQLLPYLKDLAEEGKLVAHVTAEQAQQADELTKQYGRMKMQIAIASQGFLGSMVPAIKEVIKYTNEAIERDGVWLGLLQGIGAAMARTIGHDLSGVKAAEAQVNDTFSRLAAARQKLAAIKVRGEGDAQGTPAEQLQAQMVAQFTAEVNALTAALKAAIKERNQLVAGAANGRAEKKPKEEIDPTGFQGEKTGAGEKSAIPAMKADLEAMRAAYAEQNKWQAMNRTEELAFWQMKRQQAGLSQKDITAIEAEMSKIKVEFAKDQFKEIERLRKEHDAAYAAGAKQRAAFETAQADTRKAEALLTLEQEKLATERLFKDNAISREQYIAVLRQYSAQELAIELEMIEAKRNAQVGIPEYDATAAEKEAQARLQARMAYLQRQNQIDSTDQEEKRRSAKAFEDAMASGTSQMLGQMLDRQITWRNAMLGIYQQLRAAFIQQLIVEPLRQWMANGVRMLLAKLGWLQVEEAAQKSTSQSNANSKVQEATTVVGANAAEAATAGANSAAQIPYVGWILAGVAFASILAMALGARSSIKSARGGYDIPKGVNPMVQTHEEEMILPAKYANTIRDMAESGGAEGGAASGPSYHYHDNSGRLTDAQIRRNTRIFADEMGKLHRNGWRPA